MKFIIAQCGTRIKVSDSDFSKLSRRSWYILHRGLKRKVATRIKTKRGWRWVYMHRIIMRATRGQEVDHRKGDGLDNRRCKLRLCSKPENLRGWRRAKTKKFLSQYRGVTYCKRQKKWLAQIRFHLGYFTDERQAARAYDTAARRLYGRFATPNF